MTATVLVPARRTLVSACLLVLLALGLAPGQAAAAPTRMDVVHQFKPADGTDTALPLLHARDGHWYGTAPHGGALQHGKVYRFDTYGSFAVLHAFDASLDNGHPGQRLTPSGLSEGPDGTLYGTIGGGSKRHTPSVWLTASHRLALTPCCTSFPPPIRTRTMVWNPSDHPSPRRMAISMGSPGTAALSTAGRFTA
jgi:uncharacterized repeat protein (TIGR03803 family)